MKRCIVLDSTPLGLIVQRRGLRVAEQCRDWASEHVASGRRILVPEIVDYEIRRELLHSDALRLAAEMWAKARQQGTPTVMCFSCGGLGIILSAYAAYHGQS